MLHPSNHRDGHPAKVRLKSIHSSSSPLVLRTIIHGKASTKLKKVGPILISDLPSKVSKSLKLLRQVDDIHTIPLLAPGVEIYDPKASVARAAAWHKHVTTGEGGGQQAGGAGGGGGGGAARSDGIDLALKVGSQERGRSHRVNHDAFTKSETALIKKIENHLSRRKKNSVRLGTFVFNFFLIFLFFFLFCMSCMFFLLLWVSMKIIQIK